MLAQDDIERTQLRATGFCSCTETSEVELGVNLSLTWASSDCERQGYVRAWGQDEPPLSLTGRRDQAAGVHGEELAEGAPPCAAHAGVCRSAVSQVVCTLRMQNVPAPLGLAEVLAKPLGNEPSVRRSLE